MFSISYMSENGSIRSENFELYPGSQPGTLNMALAGRIPYTELPLGCGNLTGITYDNSGANYRTVVLENAKQEDWLTTPEAERTGKTTAQRLILYLRAQGEYNKMMTDQVKHLRSNPNDIYKDFEKNGYKYAIFRQLMQTLKGRNVIRHADGQLISQLLTMSPDRGLLDVLFRSVQDPLQSDITATIVTTLSGLGL